MPPADADWLGGLVTDAAGAAEEPTPQVEIAAANDREAAAEIVADAAIATVVPEPAADDVGEADEGAGADEEDPGGVDR